MSQLGYHVYRSHQPQEMKAFYFQGQKPGDNTRATIYCALPLCWECNIHSLLHCVLTITFRGSYYYHSHFRDVETKAQS